MTVLTGAPIADAVRDLAGRQGLPARTCRWSGAAGTRRCSAPSAWTSRASTSPSRPRARSPSTRSATGWRRGSPAERPRRLPAARRGRHHPPEPAAPARRSQHPRARTTTACCPSSAITSSRASVSSTTSPPRAAPSAAPSAPIHSSTTASGSGWRRSAWASEIDELWQRYRFDDLSFQDETYFTYAPRVEAVADELLRREISDHLGGDDAGRPGSAAVRGGDGQVPALRATAGDRRRRVRLAGDDGPHQEGHQAGAGVRAAPRSAVRHGVNGIFPFIVGFPGEDDASVRPRSTSPSGCARCRPASRRPSSTSSPTPARRSPTTRSATATCSPPTSDEWSRFDFIGSAGPWVSPEKHRRIERFKFYQRLAAESGRWRAPARRLARWRLAHDAYDWPVETLLGRWLRPQPQLS